MLVKVFEDCGVGGFTVEKVFGFEVPVVCIGKVSGVQYKVVVVNCAGERCNGGVIECWLDVGDVTFAGSSIAIFAVDTELRFGSAQTHDSGIIEENLHQ